MKIRYFYLSFLFIILFLNSCSQQNQNTINIKQTNFPKDEEQIDQTLFATINMTPTNTLTPFTPTMTETFSPQPTLTPSYTTMPPTLTPFPTLVKIKCDNLVEEIPEEYYPIIPVFHQGAYEGWNPSRRYVTLFSKYHGIMISEKEENKRVVYFTEAYSDPEGILCPDYVYFNILLYNLGELIGAYKLKTSYGSLFSIDVIGSKSQNHILYSSIDNDLFEYYENCGNAFAIHLYIDKDVHIEASQQFIDWEDPNWCSNIQPFSRMELQKTVRLANGTFVSYLDEPGNCPTVHIEEITEEWIEKYGDSLPD